MVDFITPILKGVKQELKQHIDPIYRDGAKRLWLDVERNQ